MIKKLSQGEGRVLGYAVKDQITEKDLQLIDNDIDAAVDRHGKIRVLVNYEDLSGVDLDIIDDDLRLMRYMDDIERFAVVSDNRLYSWVTSASDVVTDTDIRHFEPGEEKLAWEWLK